MSPWLIDHLIFHTLNNLLFFVSVLFSDQSVCIRCDIQNIELYTLVDFVPSAEYRIWSQDIGIFHNNQLIIWWIKIIRIISILISIFLNGKFVYILILFIGLVCVCSIFPYILF